MDLRGRRVPRRTVGRAGLPVRPHLPFDADARQTVERDLRRLVDGDRRFNTHARAQFNAVVETNEYAVRLWKSLGFGVIGVVPEAFESREHGRVGLLVMHRWL